MIERVAFKEPPAVQSADRSHRESSDDYGGEIHRLGTWRVAICRDGLQYLLQRRRPGYAGVGTAWDSMSYCVTLAALLRLWRRDTGDAGTCLEILPGRAPLFDREAWRAQELRLQR